MIIVEYVAGTGFLLLILFVALSAWQMQQEEDADAEEAKQLSLNLDNPEMDEKWVAQQRKDGKL